MLFDYLLGVIFGFLCGLGVAGYAIWLKDLNRDTKNVVKNKE